MVGLMEDLFPICRSITGAGLRESLRRVGQVIPLDITEVPSGTRVFDWVVPPEWNIRAASLSDPTGRRVVDFEQSNLHVVNYSVPVRRTLTLDELRPHLHSLPDHPSWIPYRTSYYAEDWGFCLADDELRTLPPGEYEAVIDSTLEAGSLSYGECVLPGVVERGDPDLQSHLPSVARQRQPVGRGGGHVLGQGARRHGAQVHLPLPLRPRHHRRNHLAGPQRGDHRTDPRWSRPGLRRGHRPHRLQAEPPGRLGHRPGRRARPSDSGSCRTRSSTSRRTATTSGSSARRASIFRWAPSPARGYDRSERHHTSADDMAAISPDALAGTLQFCLKILGDSRGRRHLRQPQPQGRAAARPQGPVPKPWADASTRARWRRPCCG